MSPLGAKGLGSTAIEEGATELWLIQASEYLLRTENVKSVFGQNHFGRILCTAFPALKLSSGCDWSTGLRVPQICVFEDFDIAGGGGFLGMEPFWIIKTYCIVILL